jgi:ATP-dependent helicase HrpB
VDAVLPDLGRALAAGPNAVLVAAPGAGKTTRVPLALMDAPWCRGGRLLMLEPRRVAARAAARFMAAGLGERVGETVGYRVRLDSAVGPRTRIEVITEGILTRRLQADPALEGVAGVIFDEFHERALQADLGLALCLDSQGALRPDLRLLVMSATLQAEPLATLLGGPVIESPGRAHPVDVRHHPAPAPGRSALVEAMAARILAALAETPEGDLLAFLPGAGEIDRLAARLSADVPPGVVVRPLHGRLSGPRQDAALQPDPDGRRKVVLATNIAETSLTLDGVRLVVDGGLARVPRFDPARGLTRLETVRISQASATQRAGRAGRQGPGVCHRLWPKAARGALAPATAPEITQADLAPLVLDLAAWGVTDPAALPWLDPPPAGPWAAARALLQGLEALDEAGRATAHGRRLAALPLHPRLAHMVARAAEAGRGALAADLAALMAEGDPLAGREGAGDADVRARLALLRGPGEGAGRRLRLEARQIRRLAGISDATPDPDPDPDPTAPGALLALAWPDRIARARPGSRGRFVLSSGRGAVLDGRDSLAAEPWLVVADLDDGAGAEARIRLAAPLDEGDVLAGRLAPLVESDEVGWSAEEGAVMARRRRRLGALVIDDAPLRRPDPAAVAHALMEGIRTLGLDALPWSKAARSWRTRVRFLHHLEGDGSGWPDLSDAALLESLDDWLAPAVAGRWRPADIDAGALFEALRAQMPWDKAHMLDRLAPEAVTLPTGTRQGVDYADPAAPVLAVRVQALFGLDRHPAIADGRVPLVLHLLSPAGRPLQVTRDLPGFWRGAWAEVRKEMRGRYPRHPWPDDPLAAAPTQRAKPKPAKG